MLEYIICKKGHAVRDDTEQSEAVNRVKKGKSQLREAYIGSAGTVSVTGEFVQGVLGAFSFNKLMGLEAIGKKNKVITSNS